MTVKERLHRLVDALPESEAHTAERMLEFLHETATESPLMRTLRTAPLDDEPYTEEERAVVAEARKEKGIPHEEVKRMLGLA